MIRDAIRHHRPHLGLLFLTFCVAAPSAQAHFLWVTTEREDGRTVVQAFLSEQPTPDLPEFLRVIERATFSVDGHAVERTAGEGTYLLDLKPPLPRVVDGICDLGVMSRGGATFRLHYTARLQFGPLSPGAPEVGEALRVRLIDGEGQKPRLVATFNGKPAAGALVKVYREEGAPDELKTDAEGRLELPENAEKRVFLLVKYVDETPGEIDGETYPETRHYATLAVEPGSEDATVTAAPFAELPEAINSFGGAVLGDWLYVYSGHTGKRHQYNIGTTTEHFRRLNLRDRTTWEDLPCGPALQGVALVAHDGMLYRVGGMSAHNAEGEPEDLRSVASFARFDPTSKTWTEMPPMPEPRSTHDVVVSGDVLYVVGGWTMPGGRASAAWWCDSALKFDLSRSDATWEPLPEPPFARRALAAACLEGKLYVLGGLTEAGEVEKTVDVYDPATGAWSRGPDLPGERLQGFAPSAFGIEGRLYASGADGIVHRLSEAGDAWEPVGKLTVPRLTHRLLPGLDGTLIAVGGNAAGLPLRSIESIDVGRSSAHRP